MTSSAIQELTLENLRQVVAKVLPGKKLHEIRDRGTWVRQHYELVFDGGERAFVKLHIHSDWLDSTCNEVYLCEILRQNGLPAPETLFVDPAGKFFGSPFIIQRALPGKPLTQWLTEVEPADWPDLFSAIGETYARFHAIKGSVSGVWDGSPDKTLPVSPNDFYLENEILGGSGRQAMQAGRITVQEYDKIVSLWEAGLPALKAHSSSLVHGSAFPWTACLTAAGDGWQVSRLNALGDVLWWDPAYDQASWEYPPFYAWPAACLDAFWIAYGQQPDSWRIRIYALLQHVCALNKVYMPPPLPPCCTALSEEGMIARLRDILSLL